MKIPMCYKSLLFDITVDKLNQQKINLNINLKTQIQELIYSEAVARRCSVKKVLLEIS